MSKKSPSSNAAALWSLPFAPVLPSAKRLAASTSVSPRFKRGSNAPANSVWIASIGRIDRVVLTLHPDGLTPTWRSLS
jgi:hypothetical protein